MLCHVGAPLPCNLIKLVDVEELNYFASKGEGEICVKGPNVFKGYLKDRERTAEALDKDGWLHTGDVGKWLPNGTLKIIDRKKHIFKLAQGEYIAPEKIENIYIRSEPVAQAFLVGIVVPDAEVMPGWAKKKGFDGTYTVLCKNVRSPLSHKAIKPTGFGSGEPGGFAALQHCMDTTGKLGNGAASGIFHPLGCRRHCVPSRAPGARYRDIELFRNHSSLRVSK
ncbi:UNVERIFIED_CONTAM: Long-chain-fatty-acid--CoA ligase 6 [Gekko kuhli]